MVAISPSIGVRKRTGKPNREPFIHERYIIIVLRRVIVPLARKKLDATESATYVRLSRNHIYDTPRCCLSVNNRRSTPDDLDVIDHRPVGCDKQLKPIPK